MGLDSKRFAANLLESRLRGDARSSHIQFDKNQPVQSRRRTAHDMEVMCLVDCSSTRLIAQKHSQTH